MHGLSDFLTGLLLVGAAVSVAACLAVVGGRVVVRGLAKIRPYLAAFLVFAAVAMNYAQKSGGTNSPPQVATPPPAAQAPRSGGTGGEVTNLCFTGLHLTTNGVSLSIAWPTNLFADGATLDIFAVTGELTNRWEWICSESVQPPATNLDIDVSCPQLAPSATNLPSAAFFRVSDRATAATTMADADGDGLPDVYELHNGTNPYVPDAALAPRLTVGAGGEYATVESALAASADYSIVSVSPGEYVLVDSIEMPGHPVMLTGADGGYSVLRSKANIAVVKLVDGQGSDTLFRNICLVLEHEGNFQAGFWIGGNLPWSGLAASPTFENVRVRALYPDTLYYGWHYYRDDGGASSLSNCVVNAAGASNVTGVYSYGGPDVVVTDCHSVNFPTNVGNYATYFQSGTNIAAECASQEPWLSWAGYPLDGDYSTMADSDGDGLSDHDEIFVSDTDPWLADSDGDGVPDGVEVRDVTDPRSLYSLVRHVTTVVSADDVLENVTNYVAWGVHAGGWETNGVIASSESPSTNELTIATTNMEVYVKAFRDMDRDGAFSPGTDILVSRPVPLRRAVYTESIRFGDVDHDGITDTQELADGTDPQDAKSFCFNLTLVEEGVIHTTNDLTVAVEFGCATVYGPVLATNRTFVAEVGHLVATNGERVTVWLWDDADSNGVRDAGEASISHNIPVRGHENVVTNIFPTAAFDHDADGLMDWWEVLHVDAGLSPTNAADAWLDPDGDGLLNLHEFWADCDPLAYDGTNTAIYAAVHGIDDRIFNTIASVAGLYYSGYSGFLNQWRLNSTNCALTVNADCWMKDVDLSFLSVACDDADRPYGRPLTAISPLHVISASHVMIETNRLVAFRTRTGEIINRHVVATNVLMGIADDDLCLGILNEPLPNTVTTVSFLPPGYQEYIGRGERLPRVRIGRDKTCSLHDILHLSPDTDSSEMIRLATSLTAQRRAYARGPWSNDSGHPNFLLVGDAPVFLCPTRGFYYSDNLATGYLCTMYLGRIQGAMDALSIITGGDHHVLRTFSFVGFSKLPNR